MSLKRTEICVVGASGRMLWRGVADTHPGMIAETLSRWRDGLVRVGRETGSMTPWLARGLLARGLPLVVMGEARARHRFERRAERAARRLPSRLAGSRLQGPRGMPPADTENQKSVRQGHRSCRRLQRPRVRLGAAQ